MRAVYLSFGVALALAACGAPVRDTLQGYAEADYIYVSAQDPGVVESLAVAEGANVARGEALFTLNQDRARANLQSAEAQAQADRARVAGEALAAARADARLAAQTLERTRAMLARGFVSRARVDQDLAARDAANARVRQAAAEQAAAARDINAASARAGLARTQLSDRSVAAPAAGRVERIFRRPGEYVQPGEPVLTLLPPANIKLRFFAPEEMLARLSLGQTVHVSCDNCPDGLTARISFIASEPQFTPPVIYSTEERAKLVFLIEARPNRPEALRPGQPLDIRLAPAR